MKKPIKTARKRGGQTIQYKVKGLDAGWSGCWVFASQKPKAQK
jgi:hypothetical protein